MTQRREKLLLALDTSTNMVGVALYNGAEVIHETIWKSRFNHTRELAPMLQQALEQSEAGYEDLVAVAVAIGPGSFTGLRIGLALAKGIVFAHHLALIGIPTLNILAAAQPLTPEPLITVLRTGRGRFAVQRFSAGKKEWHATGTLEVKTLEELLLEIQTPAWICGELNINERQTFRRNNKFVMLVSPARSLRRPSFLAELAWERFITKKYDDPATLAPIYLHYREALPA